MNSISLIINNQTLVYSEWEKFSDKSHSLVYRTFLSDWKLRRKMLSKSHHFCASSRYATPKHIIRFTSFPEIQLNPDIEDIGDCRWPKPIHRGIITHAYRQGSQCFLEVGGAEIWQTLRVCQSGRKQQSKNYLLESVRQFWGDYSKISQTQREKWEGLAHLIPSHIVGPAYRTYISVWVPHSTQP